MAEVILEMKNITKTFPGVKALDNVNLKVEKGEIHALVGEDVYKRQVPRRPAPPALLSAA